VIVAGLAAGALILAAAPSQAALVVGPAMTDIAPAGGAAAQPYTPNLPAPSSTDLLQGLTPTSYFHPTVNLSEANFREESSGGTPALTNGSISTTYGGADNAIIHAAYATSGGGVITYTLPNPSDINQFVIYSGWNDGGRDEMNVTVGVSGDGSVFSDLFTATANTAGSTPITHRVSVVDDAGAALARNVRFVRYSFNGTENGYSGYVEMDVIGTVVPEPGSLSILGLAGAALLRRRRAR
jgi:hypothetical protein